MNKYKLLVALIAGLTLSLPVAAKLYKWVDDNGTTHYGEVIPPEYANKDREVLDKSGRVIKSQEATTPERRLAQEQENAKKREDDKAALERQRRDQTLISTYTTVQEIDLARRRSLQQVDARINFLNSNIKSANDNLVALQTEADNLTKAKRIVPNDLLGDIKNAQERLNKLQNDLEKPLEIKAELETRYDADKARYMELTGKK